MTNVLHQPFEPFTIRTARPNVLKLTAGRYTLHGSSLLPKVSGRASQAEIRSKTTKPRSVAQTISAGDDARCHRPDTYGANDGRKRCPYAGTRCAASSARVPRRLRHAQRRLRRTAAADRERVGCYLAPLRFDSADGLVSSPTCLATCPAPFSTKNQIASLSVTFSPRTAVCSAATMPPFTNSRSARK